MNMEGIDILPFVSLPQTDADKWIMHRLNETSSLVDKAVKVYRFDDMTHSVYEYFWNDFCDWYIEISKPSLYSKDEKEKQRIVSMLNYVLVRSLKLLHPFLSFITEEIYQLIPNTEGAIITQNYPVYENSLDNAEIGKKFSSIQELVTSIRTVRSEFTIPPEKKLPVSIKTDDDFRVE